METGKKKQSWMGYGVSALSIALVGYFTFTAVQGPFGMLALFEVEQKEAQLQDELAELQAARARIQNRAHRMSDGFLDLDLLDQQARKVLGYIRGDEIIIR